MLYKLLLFPSRIAIHLYCRSILINHKKWLNAKGPLLIAANHPNSFLDAILLATLFKQPIYSLARGDAFTNKWVIRILKSFNMFPVYRIGEGYKNLENNYTTFDTCQELFRHQKIVLIFSEGNCTNEWHLRALKKGTARLALEAWKQDIPLKVLPLGINYNSFRHFGKTVHLNFGSLIPKQELFEKESEGQSIHAFNSALKNQLQSLVYEIEPNDKVALNAKFNNKTPLLQQFILLLPATFCWITHLPLYGFIHLLIYKKAGVHYDGIMTGCLFLLYPFYVLLFSFLMFLLTQSGWSFLCIILLPLSVISLLHSGLLKRNSRQIKSAISTK